VHVIIGLWDDIRAPKLVLEMQGKAGSGEPDGLCNTLRSTERQQAQVNAVLCLVALCGERQTSANRKHVQRPHHERNFRRQSFESPNNSL
jgi:hypothetical protein